MLNKNILFTPFAVVYILHCKQRRLGCHNKMFPTHDLFDLIAHAWDLLNPLLKMDGSSIHPINPSDNVGQYKRRLTSRLLLGVNRCRANANGCRRACHWSRARKGWAFHQVQPNGATGVCPHTCTTARLYRSKKLGSLGCSNLGNFWRRL